MTAPLSVTPVIPLRNMVVFPGLTQVIRVGRERSVQALLKAEASGFWVVTVQQKNSKSTNEDHVDLQDLYSVGTLCRVDSMKGNPESGFQVVVRGMSRVALEDNRITEGNYIETRQRVLDDLIDIDASTKATLLDSLKQMAVEVLNLIPANTDQLAELIKGIDDLSFLTSICIGNIDIDAKEKQTTLERLNLKDRSLHILKLLQEFRDGLEVQAEIRSKLNQKLGQTQRQNILREHMKTIRDELGEESGESGFEKKIRGRLNEMNCPQEVLTIIDQELSRLSEIGPQSPETHIIRNYLDLMTALPWGKSSADTEINLEDARKILDRDHFGLEKIKKRIVQQLAVMKLKKTTKGTILLFVGPPGVGKTSLGQSIANALGRKFVRVSVGGIRDDAEIRGHRRTYVGALPGRIIQGLKRAGEDNPVFLLDEIDKMARGYHGDPAAALLEVLDPEQNQNFMDHYLDVGFDLSKVLFIGTANQLDSIPAPLLDRMEVIELSGYTLIEKLHIAKSHLIPKQMEELGIQKGAVTITDESLTRMTSSYTREAGVRELERKIAAVLRGVSERVVESQKLESPPAIEINAMDLPEILGRERYFQEVTESLNAPGVVTGLAWTPVGGDILFIESTAMPGRGELTLTGQLGDVMKESAKIALSLIKSHLPQLGVTIDLKRYDLHLHIPAGAIPKDGPSAGVTLFTSMVSLLTRRSVASKLAMTGEITLRGAVTPVGGIKEKVIAAHRAGVTDVILPEKNRRDVDEIPLEILSQLKIHYVARVEELLEQVFNLQVENMGPMLLIDPTQCEGGRISADA